VGDTPSSISTREQFARALVALRESQSLTIRQVVERSGGSLATVGGWFSGKHVPTPQNSDAFFALMSACGVEDDAERAQWWDAVLRVRKLSARRPHETPYKGLDNFEPEDAEWFFGRDQLVAELLARVEAGPRIIAVTGASGSGKSSLLRAGLMAALDVDCVITRPTLAMPDGHTPVLIVDQAEELWTPDVGTQARSEYLADLERRSADAVVVIGLRADFYAPALTEPVLLRALSAGPLVVGPMSADDMRAAITGPATRAGAAVDSALVDLLLDDLIPTGSTVTAEPGILPLLSHALLGTWQRATTPTLTVADYRATGGISGAVQQSAEEVFGSMSPAEQNRVRRVLLRLVTVDGDTVTRRRMPLGELATEGSDLALLQRFAAARLLTVDEDVVQVTHEALLTVWTRLREWIDADRVWFVNHRVLTQAAGVWIESGRDVGALLGAGRLGFYDELLATGDRADHLNSVEREFLSHSRTRLDEEAAKERRRARTRRRLVTALAVATVAAVVLAGTAIATRSDAVEQQQAAETARAQAESRQIGAQALALRERDPSVATQLAVAAYRKSPTYEARSTLLDSTGLRAPTRLLAAAGSSVVTASPTASTVAVGRGSGDVEFYAIGDEFDSIGRVSVGTGVPVYALSFDSTGSTLAVGTASGVQLLDVSDVSDPKVLWSRPSTTSVAALAFQPNSRVLAAGTAGSAVLRFDVGAGGDPVPLLSLELPSSSRTMVAYSPDGRHLVAAGSGQGMRVWNTDELDRLVVDTPSDGSTNNILALDFSTAGDALIAGTTGREIRQWAVAPSGVVTARSPLAGFTSYVNSVAFSADDTFIAGGSSDLTTRVWNTRNIGAGPATLPGPAVVTGVQFDSSTDTVVTGDEAGTIRRWSLPGPVLTDAEDTLFTNPSDAAGTRLLGGVGRRGSGAPLWNLSDIDRPVLETPLLTPAPGTSLTGASALSSDGKLAVVGTDTGGFQLWDTSNTAAVRPAGSVPKAVQTLTASLSLNREADMLAVSGQNASDISLWSVGDVQAPRQTATFEVLGLPTVLAFSPTASLLAIATSSEAVELWDVGSPTSPTRISTLGGFEADATSVAFSRDGTTLAAGSGDRSVRLWDVRDPRQPRPLGTARTASAVTSVAFSPDAALLAAGISTDSLVLWDATDVGNLVPFATLTAAQATINDPAFLAGGDVVAGGGVSKHVHLWRTKIDQAVDFLCGRAGSVITEEEWEVLVPGVEYEPPC
jgi:WD40 repeat protein/transcriptional regulator with XRE-family HTH domain